MSFIMLVQNKIDMSNLRASTELDMLSLNVKLLRNKNISWEFQAKRREM